MNLNRPHQTNLGASIIGAHLYLFLATFIWAGNYISVKVILTQIPPNTVAFLRFLVSCLIIVVFSIVTRQAKMKKEDFGWAAFTGICGFSLFTLFQNNGLKYTNATDAAVFASLTPVFMAIIGFLLYKETITSRKTMGIVVAFIGAFIVATNGSWNFGSLNLARLWGDFLIILTGLCWAFYNVGIKKLLPKYSIGTILTYTNIFGVLFLLPFMLSEKPQLEQVNLPGWLIILYLGIFASLLANLFWNKGVRIVPMSSAGTYLYFTPILTTIIAFFLLREIPSIYTILGGIITLIGVYFAGEVQIHKKGVKLTPPKPNCPLTGKEKQCLIRK